MFRDVWVFHRRAVLAAVIVVALPAATTFVVLASHPSHGPSTPTAATAARQAAPTSDPTPTTVGPAGGSPTNARNVPLRVVPPATETQTRIDAELAADESRKSFAEAATLTMPAPMVSSAYPAVPGADRTDPTAYVLAFSRELLTVDYRTQTRAGLLRWAESEEAPNTLPGVPAQLGDKALVGSLAYSVAYGTGPSPVAAADDWATPSSGTTQQVTGLAGSTTPTWTQVIASGWEPTDPLLTFLTVTGNIIVSTPGHRGAPRSFSMVVALGGARFHPGYGAVVVEDWTVV